MIKFKIENFSWMQIRQVAELLPKKAFLEKTLQVENEAKRLGMLKELAKARARAQILDNVEFGEKQELQTEILENHQQFFHSTQTKKKNSKESHSQQESHDLNLFYQAEQERFSSQEKVFFRKEHF